MAHLLMPKATAVWLVENTALTFDQIADFCELHPLEVQGIADGEVAVGITGLDPIANGQLTRDEITACEADASRKLSLAESTIPAPKVRAKGPRYTPVAKRHDRPNAIAWLLRFHPELSDGQISKLVGTTKPTINAIRDRTHWNISNLKLEDPVSLGMCSQLELDQAVARAAARQRAREKREAREAKKLEVAARASESGIEAPTSPVPVTAEAAPEEMGAGSESTEAEGKAPMPIWSPSEPQKPAAREPRVPSEPAAPEEPVRADVSIEADQVFSTPSGTAAEPATEEEELDPEKIFAQPDVPAPAAPPREKRPEGEAAGTTDASAEPPKDPRP